jgi:hypothetical protein
MTDVEVYEAPKQILERLTPEQVRYIANTEIIPKALRGRPEAIMATILKGRSLGLDDINSLSAIHFIEGKAGLSAETMVHLVRKRGHSVVWEAKPGESCTVVGTRRDNGDTGSVTWTMQMAKDAGLAGKGSWKQYPDAMLWARAATQLCRMLFADVLMGTSYSPEELEEVAERGRVTEAVTDLPGVEEATVRREPSAGPSEAQLNRIAHLEERAGPGYLITLRGVFGAEMASELDADAAARYEATLALALPPEDSGQGAESDSPRVHSTVERGAGEEPQEDGAPTPAADSAEGPEGVPTPHEDSAGGSVSSDPEKRHESPSADELPGEPSPEDEVVEAEVVEESDERLVEIAGETLIPSGNYRGSKLADIHDGWIEYALRAENIARLPEPFVEALELWARERKPEIWEKVRG